MENRVEIKTVDGANFESLGFFCYKSKPKSQGYQNKLSWLRERFNEGLRIKILYEDDRSVGFIEYVPGEYTWRAVEAPGYLLINCLWVVGRAKEKGYGSRLINECLADAQDMGKLGAAMVSSKGNWVANEKVFLQNGFETIDSAPPSFSLLVKQIKAGPEPHFPKDWDQRQALFGEGMTVVYANQCPYMPNAVQHALNEFASRNIEARAVKLKSSQEIRAKSPSPYGVFGIVYNGKLFCYHYLGKKELRRLDEELLKNNS